MIEIVKELIKQDGLDQKNRRRDIINKRIYLWNYLRDNGLTFHQIGNLFAKDHATIIHGIRTYKNLSRVNDKDLHLDTEYYRLLIEINKPEVNLRKEVAQAKNLVDLRNIQRRILNNIY